MELINLTIEREIKIRNTIFKEFNPTIVECFWTRPTKWIVVHMDGKLPDDQWWKIHTRVRMIVKEAGCQNIIVSIQDKYESTSFRNKVTRNPIA